MLNAYMKVRCEGNKSNIDSRGRSIDQSPTDRLNFQDKINLIKLRSTSQTSQPSDRGEHMKK